MGQNNLVKIETGIFKKCYIFFHKKFFIQACRAWSFKSEKVVDRFLNPLFGKNMPFSGTQTFFAIKSCERRGSSTIKDMAKPFSAFGSSIVFIP